jgi:hypothetical protein
MTFADSFAKMGEESLRKERWGIALLGRQSLAQGRDVWKTLHLFYIGATFAVLYKKTARFVACKKIKIIFFYKKW